MFLVVARLFPYPVPPLRHRLPVVHVAAHFFPFVVRRGPVPRLRLFRLLFPQRFLPSLRINRFAVRLALGPHVEQVEILKHVLVVKHFSLRFRVGQVLPPLVQLAPLRLLLRYLGRQLLAALDLLRRRVVLLFIGKQLVLGELLHPLRVGHQPELRGQKQAGDLRWRSVLPERLFRPLEPQVLRDLPRRAPAPLHDRQRVVAVPHQVVAIGPDTHRSTDTRPIGRAAPTVQRLLHFRAYLELLLRHPRPPGQEQRRRVPPFQHPLYCPRGKFSLRRFPMVPNRSIVRADRVAQPHAAVLRRLPRVVGTGGRDPRVPHAVALLLEVFRRRRPPEAAAIGLVHAEARDLGLRQLPPLPVQVDAVALDLLRLLLLPVHPRLKLSAFLPLPLLPLVQLRRDLLHAVGVAPRSPLPSSDHPGCNIGGLPAPPAVERHVGGHEGLH
mmetsp:Transcript_23726/g.59944  ORF Transcript_23726/g.59944 Transcript_23726/m.59944 type:complete len:440 (-) Transcript_23726:2246-3565(-)